MTVIEFPRSPKPPTGISDAIEILENELDNLHCAPAKERRKLERIISQLMKIEERGNA